MARNIAVILAILLSIALMPQQLVSDAHAKMLSVPNADHTHSQLFQLMVMPAFVAGALLFMIALYSRQNQQLSTK